MKKLMIALSAAAMAFGLRAADSGFISGTCFGDDAVGAYSAASPLWTTVEDANRVLTVDGSGVSYGGDHPAQWDTATDTNFLKVKTTFGKPIEMNTLNSVGVAAEAKTIGAGLYFDSLVKFTVCDEAPAADGYAGAKVMVWLQENTDGTATNFYVRAGKYAGGSWSGADFKCAAISSFNVDAWHRLTIKAIADIYTAKGATDYTPGFVVFVDGQALKGVDVKTTSGIVEAELNGSAAEFFDTGKLFASMVQGEVATKNQLSAVGFDGQGELDELSFTTVAPTFAVDPAARIATVGDTVCYSVENINAAIAAATEAMTITLLRPVTGDLEFAGATQNFALNLNGKTLNGGIVGVKAKVGEDPVMYAGTLTIDDTVGTGTVEGALTGGSNPIVLNAGKYLASANEVINEHAVAKSGYQIKLNGSYYEIAEILEDGSAAKPWQISTVADFTSKFATLSTLDVAHQNFKLMNNIDFDNAVFAGIGTSAAPFQGVFDGDGKTISGYKLPALKSYQGFFMVISNATIKSVTMQIAGFDVGTANTFGGAAVAGEAYGACRFIGVTTAGTLTGGEQTDGKPKHVIAGMVVGMYGASEFTDCTNNVNIVSGQRNKTAGFVSTPSASVAGTTLKFTRCVNNGNLECTQAASDGGTAAFCGWTSKYNVIFEDCVNNGTITSSNAAQLGSFCGKLYGTCSASFVGTCTTTATTIPAIGTTDLQATEAPDFNFATVSAGVATFVKTPVVGGSYKVMLPTASFSKALALDEAITFDATLGGTITITAADAENNYIATSGDPAVTYTCTAKTTPTITVTVDPAVVEYTAGLTFPTPTVTGASDYTTTWSPDTITEPAAGTTNDYVVTISVAATETTKAAQGQATWKVFKGASVEPVKPGTDGEVTIDPTGKTEEQMQAEAEQKAAQIPIQAADEDAAAAGQTAVLKRVVTANGDGTYRVTVAIDTGASAYKAPEVAVSTVATKLTDISAAEPGADVNMTVPAANVTPGLYYSIDVATELGASADFVEGDRELATSAGVTLNAKKPASGNAAFFKVTEHMTKTPSNK